MWLKLTAKTAEKKFLYINSDKICLMEELKEGGTQILFENPDFWAKVRETPEEIFRMINPLPVGAVKIKG